MQQQIIGKVIDNYEITGILGKGGMGVVYKAKDTTLDRDVALKMMDANFARDEEFLKRFKSEAKALAKLQNANIVSVFALRETELGFALVMEFVEGGTLADVIRSSGAMPLQRALPIFRQMLTAMDHAHRAGIIHRDIKPSNVMLAPNDVVKVTDFGLAKIQQVSTATMTMGTGGTLYYMSPEQVRGLANVDARGDIYSLGMTLYETITGRIPFGNDATDFDIRQKIVTGKIDPPDRFNPALPREINKVIMRSIEKDPEKRFQSAAEMWNELSRMDVQNAEMPKVIAPAPNLKKHRSSRRPLYFTVGAGAVAIAAVFGIRSFTSTSSATLAVTSFPAGASVSVNGKSIGKTPIREVALEPGKLSLRLEADGFVAKETSLTLTNGEGLAVMLGLDRLTNEKPGEDIAVNNNRTVSETRNPINKPVATKSETRNVLPTINIVVIGDAFGGTILVDGVRFGDAPKSNIKLEAGPHRITVTKFGFQTVEGEREVTIQPSTREEVIRLSFTLKKE